jgi:predicted esterase
MILLTTPAGIAQQFQFNSKLPYLRWVLPNAPHNHEAMVRAWYVPKELPNPMKPRVPGHEDDVGSENDEEGIMKSVRYVDQLVQEEVRRGVEPGRIVVGGFSMGCAIALVWGLVSESKSRENIAGVVGLSGYLPMFGLLENMRDSSKPAAAKEDDDREKKWFVVHGTRDMLVPTCLFNNTKKILSNLVTPDCVETNIYENMGHSTCASELHDLLTWLEKVVPA